MKKALAIALFSTCLRLSAADPHMSADERAKAIRLLQSSQKEFLSSVEGLTDEQWNYKPGPDRWSVGETAEHILLSEGELFAYVQKALASDPNPDWEAKTKGKTEFIEKVMGDRSHKAQAPEGLRPTNRFGSPQDSLKHFEESRAKTIQFLKDTKDLRQHAADNPALGKKLDAYQWILFVGAHSERHTKQINEVKADPNFPKK